MDQVRRQMYFYFYFLFVVVSAYFVVLDVVGGSLYVFMSRPFVYSLYCMAICRLIDVLNNL